MRLRMPFIVFALITAPVSAQDFGASNYSNMAFGGLVTNQINITQSAVGKSKAEVSRRLVAPPVPREALQRLGGSTRYTPSVADRRRNLARIASKMRASGDPTGADAITSSYPAGDIIQQADRSLRKLGMRTDDVADAYTIWWISAWKASRRDTTDASPASVRAVRAQTARALLTAPDFRRAGNAQKQEFAEALVIQTALLEAATDKYANDAKMGPMLMRAARQGALASGIDLDAMRLTEGGFVPR